MEEPTLVTEPTVDAVTVSSGDDKEEPWKMANDVLTKRSLEQPEQQPAEPVEDPAATAAAGLAKMSLQQEDSSTTAQTLQGDSSDSDDDVAAVAKPAAPTTTTASTVSAPMKRTSCIKIATLSETIPLKLGKKSFRMMPEPDVQQIHLDKVKRGATLPAANHRNDPAAIFAAMSGGYSQAQVAAGGADLPILENGPTKGNVSVGFRDIHVRSYRQTISDNPSVGYGPPIGLDWKVDKEETIPLESYEEERPSSTRRPFKKLGLSYYKRKEILEGEGHTEAELKAAKKAANKDKFQRGITKYFLPAAVLEDAAESGARKVKRIFGGGSKKDKK